MKYCHKNRLLKLAEFLRTIKPKKFNLKDWISDGVKHQLEAKDLHKCNTTACALGYACTIPSFRKAGLKLSLGTPTINEQSGIYAAVEFFGITSDEADYLFMDYYYENRTKTTPIQVSNRIKAFVKNGGIPKQHLNEYNKPKIYC